MCVRGYSYRVYPVLRRADHSLWDEVQEQYPTSGSANDVVNQWSGQLLRQIWTGPKIFKWGILSVAHSAKATSRFSWKMGGSSWSHQIYQWGTIICHHQGGNHFLIRDELCCGGRIHLYQMTWYANDRDIKFGTLLKEGSLWSPSFTKVLHPIF